MLMPGQEHGVRDAFRSHIQELRATEAQIVQYAVAILSHPSLRLDSHRHELCTLVFHQGHQRRDDQAKPSTHDCGQLKAQALAATRREECECVFSIRQIQNWVNLVLPQLMKPPM